jgi:hypothetical protein
LLSISTRASTARVATIHGESLVPAHYYSIVFQQFNHHFTGVVGLTHEVRFPRVTNSDDDSELDVDVDGRA